MTLQNCQCGKRLGTYRTTIYGFGRLGCSACWIQNLGKNIRNNVFEFHIKDENVFVLLRVSARRADCFYWRPWKL